MAAPKGNKNTLGKHWKVKNTSKMKHPRTNVIWNKGKKMTEEQKKKISKNNAKYWKGKKRSKKTVEKIKRTKRKNPMRGEKSSNWQGGITEIKKRMRGWWAWKEWREIIYKRDNWTCKMCGKRGGKLEPHHIIPLRTDLTLIYDVENGITLCYLCHRKTIGKEEKFIELFQNLI